MVFQERFENEALEYNDVVIINYCFELLMKINGRFVARNGLKCLLFKVGQPVKITAKFAFVEKHLR